jgi:outer membrane protein TolC
MRSAQKQPKDAQAYFLQGLIGSYERHTIALEALRSEQTTLESLSALAVAKLTLQSAIGEPISTEPIAPKPPNSTSFARQKLKTLALRNRSELKSLEALINAQREQKTKAFSPALPSAEFQIAKEKYEYDGGFSGADEQTVATIALVWQLPGVAKPYFDRQAALYEQRALESRLNDAKKALELQLASADERLLLAEKAYEIAKESLILAEENLRIAQNRFNERIASASDLIDADAALWQARERRAFYYYEKLLALADLERVVESDLTPSAIAKP